MSEKERQAAAFNLWMDDFVNKPDEFRRTNALAQEHLQNRLDGRAPTYGETAAATLGAYMERVGG